MKPTVLFISIICIGVVLCAVTLVWAQEHQIREEIEAVNRKFETAIAQGDGEAVATLYTENAQLLPPNSPSIQGQEAIAGAMQGMIDMGAKRIDLQTLEVEGVGKRAYEIGTYTLYGEDDQPIDEGKYTVVWQRENGTWKLHWDIWNSSRPLPVLKRANTGEQVGIAIYRIKPDKQAAFEQFVHEVLTPAASKVEPVSSQLVRLWSPIGAASDGSLHYAFVFDPYLEGGDYSIASLLERAYGRESATQHMRNFKTYFESYTYRHFVQEK